MREYDPVSVCILDTVPGTPSFVPQRQGGGNPQKHPAVPHTQGGPASKKRQADPAIAGENYSRKHWEHYLGVWKLVLRMKEKKRVIKEAREALEADSAQFRKMVYKYESEIKSGHSFFPSANPVVQGGGALANNLSVAFPRYAKGPAESSSGQPSGSPEARREEGEEDFSAGEGDEGLSLEEEEDNASAPPSKWFVDGILKGIWEVSDPCPEGLSAWPSASL